MATEPAYSESVAAGLVISTDPGVSTAFDAALTPVYDEATHQTNRAGVYLAGTVCGGLHTSRWFIENGRHHAKVIAADMASSIRQSVAA